MTFIIDKKFVDVTFADVGIGELFVVDGNGCRKLSSDSYNWYPNSDPVAVIDVSPSLPVRVLVNEYAK